MCNLNDIENVIDIAVTILTSLLIGGTVMQFFESQHSYKHINDVYFSRMRPFYSKLTKYLIFLMRINNIVVYKDKDNKYIQRLTKNINELSKIGSSCVMSGNDVCFMNSSEISAVCERINDIWLYYENNNITSNVELDSKSLDTMRGEIIDSLNAYSLEYSDRKIDIDICLLPKVSGEFYTKIWQPVQNVTYSYEHLKNELNGAHCLIRLNILITSISLLIILVCYGSIGRLFVCIVVAINLFLFIYTIFKADKVRQNIQKFV